MVDIEVIIPTVDIAAVIAQRTERRSVPAVVVVQEE
jgi:hypothetical protein